MVVWFHGTTKENADIILREGFRPGTFFGKHMEDALHFGGGYIFEVYFAEAPSTYWEWCNDETIPPSEIRVLINVRPEVVFWARSSSDVGRRMCQQHLDEDAREHDQDSYTICDVCDGRGQLEEYPPLHRWRDRGKVTTCTKCGGYGSPEKMAFMKNGMT